MVVLYMAPRAAATATALKGEAYMRKRVVGWATACATVTLGALALVGSASAGAAEQASCIGALVSAAAPGQSDFPPGFTGDTTRFLHQLAKDLGIPPGQTDALIEKSHGPVEVCLAQFPA